MENIPPSQRNVQRLSPSKEKETPKPTIQSTPASLSERPANQATASTANTRTTAYTMTSPKPEVNLSYDEEDGEEEYQFDEGRIPPDFYPRPDLYQLPRFHPVNRAWQQFHFDFFQLVGPKVRAPMSGGPFALPEIEEDSEPVPIFVVFLSKIDIEVGYVFHELSADIRKLVDQHIPPVNGRGIPIRVYEWFFTFNGDVRLRLKDMPIPQLQPSYEYSATSKMGHSVGPRCQVNEGTIFCFVDLFNKETGEKKEGRFAIIPSHVATSMEHENRMEAPNPSLCPLNSPGTGDHMGYMSQLGAAMFGKRQLLGKKERILDESMKQAALQEIILNIETLSKSYETTENFNCHFGKVLYASGISRSSGREHVGDWISYRNLYKEDAPSVPSLVDFAIVELDAHRDGLNVLPNEEGVTEWPDMTRNNEGRMIHTMGSEEWQSLMNPKITRLEPFQEPWSDVDMAQCRIVKYGERTRLTEAEVLQGRQPFWFEGKEFANYAVMAHEDRVFQWPRPFCAGGDSGAPYITRDGKVLGMHIAGYADEKGLPKRRKEMMTSAPKTFKEHDMGFFMRWEDLAAEVKKHTKWRMEWHHNPGVTATHVDQEKEATSQSASASTAGEPTSTGTSQPTLGDVPTLKPTEDIASTSRGDSSSPKPEGSPSRGRTPKSLSQSPKYAKKTSSPTPSLHGFERETASSLRRASSSSSLRQSHSRPGSPAKGNSSPSRSASPIKRLIQEEGLEGGKTLRSKKSFSNDTLASGSKYQGKKHDSEKSGEEEKL